MSNVDFEMNVDNCIAKGYVTFFSIPPWRLGNSYVCGCLFFYPPTHTFFGSSRHVTHLAYTWTCVCNEPEIKVRQHSREDIKVIYDPGRCYENLPFYFFFYFLFSKNPRLCTLDPRHVTLDPRLCTLDPRPSTKTQTPSF